MKVEVTAVVLFCSVLGSTFGEFVSKEPRTFGARLKQARRILSEVPLVDGHNDLAMCLHDHLDNQLDFFDFNELADVDPWRQDQFSQTDLPRLKKGMVGAEFWSAWVPCHAPKVDPMMNGLEQIDVIKRLIMKYPMDLQYAESTEGIINAFERGHLASLIGVEGGHTIDNSLAVLRLLYANGVRYLTLTHSCDTEWAESSMDRNSTNKMKGLTDFGMMVVGEMNRLGMMVDLSHSSQNTMEDTLMITAAPVIFSHSVARALCDNPANVPDEVLRKLRRNGGIIMVNFFPPYLTCSEKASLHDVIDHINHIREVAGVDHVGIGSDFNGMRLTASGLEDVSTFPYLFAELLLDPKWTDEDLRKLAGLNFLRVFELVESVKEMLSKEQPIDVKMSQM